MIEIFQVIPNSDFKVLCYFSNGDIRLFDAAYLLSYPKYAELKDPAVFIDKCTVMAGTLAFDLAGGYDESRAATIDVEYVLANSLPAEEPAWLSRLA